MIPASAFSQAFVAAPDAIDELGHVNNAVWVQWMQSLATAHWAHAATADQQARYFWVIVRHEIDYHRALLPGQRAIGHTWVADPPKGAKFDRLIAFVDDDGQRLLSARTTWALFDRPSQRPTRVPPELTARFLG